MKKIWLVAGREFMATVANRGFVVGLLIVPVVMALATFILPRLLGARSGQLRGEVAVIDRTGLVAADLRTAISPASIERRREEAAARALASVPAAMRNMADAGQATRLLEDPPDLRIVERPATADVQATKAWLTERTDGPRHVALVVIHPNAVTGAPAEGELGTYDIYVPPTVDDRVESTVYDGVRDALLTARVRARGLDRPVVDAMMRVTRPTSVTVGAGEERQTNIGFNRAMPFIFGALLLVGIIIGGQSLLTSTVEEKSSRVVEVLLSAVSPVELMAGKIIGQMGITLLVMVLYIGAGMMVLTSFAMLGLLDSMLVVYLLIFFVISFLLYSAVFAAVGAAVNEMREAQSLMTPVMLTLMGPWILGSAIARDPNSTFSLVLSFIPPVNSFAMMMRLASTSPPPAWQAWLSILVGFAGACAVVWVAAKIFKVGLLMHGRPPSFATLLRWVRQA